MNRYFYFLLNVSLCLVQIYIPALYAEEVLFMIEEPGKQVPIKNEFKESSGCYIACYSRNKDKSAYSIGSGKKFFHHGSGLRK